MKIHTEHEILKVGYTQQTQKNKKSDNKGFGAILKETIENASKTGPEIQNAPVLHKGTGIQFIPSPSISANPNIERVERLLDTLDKYRQKLNSPHVTLKELHPLIQEIEREKENLIPAINSLSDKDGLKNILNEVLLTSSMETIRFNRGDYINN